MFKGLAFKGFRGLGFSVQGRGFRVQASGFGGSRVGTWTIHS